MLPTGETGKTPVINSNRWWKCFYASTPNLALPYPNSWLEIHFVLLAKIIACSVFQLEFQSVIGQQNIFLLKKSVFCPLKLCWQYLLKSWWSNGKIIQFQAKIIDAAHSRPLQIRDLNNKILKYCLLYWFIW